LLDQGLPQKDVHPREQGRRNQNKLLSIDLGAQTHRFLGQLDEVNPNGQDVKSPEGL